MSAKRPPADVVAQNKNPLICHIVCIHIQPCWGEEFCSWTIYTLHENHHALHTKKKTLFVLQTCLESSALCNTKDCRVHGEGCCLCCTVNDLSKTQTLSEHTAGLSP